MRLVRNGASPITGTFGRNTFPSTTAKYHNSKTEVDGLTFDSKHEATRYVELKYLQRIGKISELQMQVPFELIPSQKDDEGKAIRAVTYKADFTYRDEKGNFVVEDAKSPATKTEVYKIKKKLMKWRYGLEIKEV